MLAVVNDVCLVFGCNPKQALKQDLDIVNGLLGLRSDGAIFAMKGEVMTEAQSARFDELADSASNRAKFIARHAWMSGEE